MEKLILFILQLLIVALASFQELSVEKTGTVATWLLMLTSAILIINRIDRLDNR